MAGVDHRPFLKIIVDSDYENKDDTILKKIIKDY